MTPDYLPIALRAYTEYATPNRRLRRRRKALSWKRPRLVLVLDTETGTDRAQALSFGCARICRLTDDGLLLLREVLFHADDLGLRDPSGLERLRKYSKEHGIELLSRREFVNKILWPVGYKARAWIVGFNLPFDLSRLAVSWGAARKSGRGGFSLVLWDYLGKDGVYREHPYRPRVHILTIDSRRALISFRRRLDPDADDLIPEESTSGEPEPGYRLPGNYLDLRTLAFALTNEGHTLASACEEFGVEHAKLKAERHGVITRRYIRYCRRDVVATAELFEQLLAEYEHHPIGLSPTRARSPAAIAKAYLRAMGITPPLEQNPRFSRQRLGQAMCAYFGGRTECRIRRIPSPVVYLDFLSMYPTVNALMGLWQLMTAKRIETVDATAAVRSLLEAVDLDRCFNLGLWRELPVLCRVKPQGEIVPARADYACDGSWQIGINPLTCRDTVWIALADLITAKLLGGSVPKVIEAVRFVPVRVQQTLCPVRLRGELDVDPVQDDFFRRLIEERKLLGQPENETAQTSRLDQTLKVTANSGSYGITAEMTRRESGSHREMVAVYGPSGRSDQRLSAFEEPGEFCFPPLAACITAGARLMLAMLERAVTDLGGCWVLCDTDSMGIVATPGGGLVACEGGSERLPSGEDAVRALSFGQVNAIVQGFATLNPYDRDAISGSILKVESENYDANHERRQLYAYAISAKRYCLYTFTRDGKLEIVKYSEHGLGHLLNPIDPESTDRDWIRQTWELHLRRELGLPLEEPDWLDRPALTKLAVTSPAVLEPFEAYNEGRQRSEQIRPYNFLLHAQVAPFGHPAEVEAGRFRLVAPYDPDPAKWPTLAWVNLYSGTPHEITASGNPSPDIVRVKTYRDVLGLHATHPEPKSVGPDGKTCTRSTRGLLRRRPITASTIDLIGKESNRLEERTAGLLGDLTEAVTTYSHPDHDPWRTLVLPVLATIRTQTLVGWTGLDPRTIQRLRKGSIYPHSRTRAILTLVATEHAERKLREQGHMPPDDLLACLAALAALDRTPLRSCPVCAGST